MVLAPCMAVGWSGSHRHARRAGRRGSGLWSAALGVQAHPAPGEEQLTARTDYPTHQDREAAFARYIRGANRRYIADSKTRGPDCLPNVA